MQTTRVFGFDILIDKKTDLFAFLKDFLAQKDQKTLKVFTPNPEQIVLSKHNRDFASYLKQADVLLPDGVGLVRAASTLRFFGKTDAKIKERITGVEVVEHLLNLAKKNDFKILIVGGRDYAQYLVKEENIFWNEGYQNKDHIHSLEEETIEKQIREIKPDLVFVCFGAPHQEQWIIEHTALLEKNGVKLAMAVGGSFDFIFHKIPRAPLFLQKMGFEWLFRLVKQPWRGHRQLRLIEFIGLLFKEIF